MKRFKEDFHFQVQVPLRKAVRAVAVALLASGGALHAQEQKSLHELVQESTQFMTGATTMTVAMPMMALPMMK